MNKSFFNLLYFTAFIAIISGFILSTISYLQICTTSCGGAHQYKLWGLSFEDYGLVFFPILAFLHYHSQNNEWMRFFASLLIAGAVGSEMNFLSIQKYEIKSFCPICLGIAGCIAIAAIAYLTSYFYKLKNSILHHQKGDIMGSIRKGIITTLTVFLGFLFSFAGIAKENPLESAEKDIKTHLAFGQLESPITVYLFTDWQCPACRSIEPSLYPLIPKITQKARLVFVDTVAHKATLNFIPFNVSFLIHDKPKYLQLRKILTAISINNPEPTEQEIQRAIEPLGVKYQQLNYSDIASATAYFEHLVTQYEVEMTPTLVIVQNQQKTKLLGSEINEKNILPLLQH